MASGVGAVWVPVDAMDRAVAFYRDVLGLEVLGQQEEWSEVDGGGLRIGLNAREGTSRHAEAVRSSASPPTAASTRRSSGCAARASS